VIIVTGTKRSGTSMWMQVLRAAGVHVLGEAFPKNWEQTIREANPHGFYESPLRGGIYYATNPDPRTGTYLRPQDVTSAAVKVFIPGLCRTDLAYVGRVVGTMRHWREYSSSLARLRAMEDDARREKLGDEAPVFPRLDPVLEWWLENFALVRDIVTRQYPAHLVSYERVLARPTETLMPLLEWVGAPDPQAGAEVVSPQTRTQARASEEEASVRTLGMGPSSTISTSSSMTESRRRTRSCARSPRRMSRWWVCSRRIAAG